MHGSDRGPIRHDFYTADSGRAEGSRGLNAAERDVLRLSAEGLTSRQVADRLGWPLECVRACLTGAIVALGARSKLEAVVLAYRRGELVDAV